MANGIELFRSTAATTPPSLADLVVVYPAAGLSPDPATPDAAAEALARNNPPQITTLQALADAVRPPAASTVTAGVVELATIAQAREGIDNTRAVTPAGLSSTIVRVLLGISPQFSSPPIPQGSPTTGVSLSFTSLNDTPSSLGTAGQYLRVNTTRDSLEFVEQPLPTGAQIVDALRALSGTARLPATAVRDLPAGTLRGLSDTPSGIGTPGQVLVVNADSTGYIYADAPTGGGDGGGLSAVQSDSTLTGAGTLQSLLRVANPYTAAEKTKLAGIAAGAEVNVRADWDATSGDSVILNKPPIPTPPTAISTRNLLESLSGNDRLPASAIRDLSAGVSAFTALNDTPGSFSGRGGQLLRVNSAGSAIEFTTPPNSITSSERNKLTGIESGATADQTASEIVTALSGLSGTARLPASAVEGLSRGAVARDVTEYIYRRTATSTAPVISPIATSRARWFFGTIPTAVEDPLEGENPTAEQLQAALDSSDVEEVTSRIQFLNNQNEVPVDQSAIDRIGFTWDGSRSPDDHSSDNIFLATTANIDARSIFRFGIVGYTSTTNFNAVTRIFGRNSFTLHKQIADADGVIWNVWGVTNEGSLTSLNTIRMIFVNNNTFTSVATHYSAFAAALREFTVEQTPAQQDGYIPDDWTGVPTGVTPMLPFEWVSARRGKPGAFGNFSTPAILERQGGNLTRGSQIWGTDAQGVQIPLSDASDSEKLTNLEQGRFYYMLASANATRSAGGSADGDSAAFVIYVPGIGSGFNRSSVFSYGTFAIDGNSRGAIQFTALTNGTVEWELVGTRSTIYASIFEINIE